MTKNNVVIAAHLRQNCRTTLTALSRKTGISVSALFNRIRRPELIGVTRFSALVDFPALGFSTQATVLLKTVQEKRDALKVHLLKSHSVNSLMRVNNGYDFLAECVFRDLRGLEEFCDEIVKKYCVKAKEVHCVIEELKRESFLSDPALLEVEK